MHCVRVGEEEPLAPCLVGAGYDCIVLTCPSGRQRSWGDDAHSSKGESDFPGAIGRTIIDDNDFEGYSRLGGQRLQAGFKRGLLVASRYDDGYLGTARWIGCHHDLN